MPDDVMHSYYLRVIQARIGEQLRRQFNTEHEPLPDRLAELLKELEAEEDSTEPPESSDPSPGTGPF